MKQRKVLKCLGAIAVVAAFGGVGSMALAQQTPLRVLVGFPAGGSTDTIARGLAHAMSEQLQRPVVVENRPGAGGQIAATALKNAAPDGNTLFLSNSHALSMIPLTVRNPGYDTLKDFASVGLVAYANDVMAVNPKLVGNVGSLKDLVGWANANRGKANIGVPAPASDPDLGVRILSKELKGDLTSVPYRGDAPVVQDLVAGQIPAGIGSIGAMVQYEKTGQIRIIAVSGPSRLTMLPNVPTYAEQGLKGYGVSGFIAMVAPMGMSKDLIVKYNKVLTQVVKSPGFQDKVSGLGVIPTSSSPEELGTLIRDTNAAFSAMIEKADFKVQ